MKDFILSGKKILVNSQVEAEIVSQIARQYCWNDTNGNICSGKFWNNYSNTYIVYRDHKIFYGCAHISELNHYLTFNDAPNQIDMPSKSDLIDFLTGE